MSAYNHARASLLVVCVSSGSSSLLLLSLLSLFNALTILYDLAGGGSARGGGNNSGTIRGVIGGGRALSREGAGDGDDFDDGMGESTRIASLVGSLVSLAALLLVVHAMLRYARGGGGGGGAVSAHTSASLHEAVAEVLGLDADDDDDDGGNGMMCSNRRGGVSDETIASLRISRVGHELEECDTDDGGMKGDNEEGDGDIKCGNECVGWRQGRLAKVGGECPICIGSFEHGDEVAHLHCGHQFHRECIASWLSVRDTCPTCRACVIDHAASQPPGVLASLVSFLPLPPPVLGVLSARRHHHR